MILENRIKNYDDYSYLNNMIGNNNHMKYKIMDSSTRIFIKEKRHFDKFVFASKKIEINENELQIDIDHFDLEFYYELQTQKNNYNIFFEYLEEIFKLKYDKIYITIINKKSINTTINFFDIINFKYLENSKNYKIIDKKNIIINKNKTINSILLVRNYLKNIQIENIKFKKLTNEIFWFLLDDKIHKKIDNIYKSNEKYIAQINIEYNNFNRIHSVLYKDFIGIGLGYKIYKKMCIDLGFISTENDSTNDARKLWKKLLNDYIFEYIITKEKILLIYGEKMNDNLETILKFYEENKDFIIKISDKLKYIIKK